jgi:hypothetical protein
MMKGSTRYTKRARLQNARSRTSISESTSSLSLSAIDVGGSPHHTSSIGPPRPDLRIINEYKSAEQALEG